ncbi:MAG TPA: thiamine phosphate synthase [Vicinamibacterales bacterium]
MHRLHAIVDVDVATAAGWSLADLARAFLDGGAPLVQIRAKRLPSDRFLQLCDLVVERARPYGATVIVNDRADLARLSGATGVHVGQEDLAPADARAIVGESSVIGYSTHTIAQVDQAAREPVDYIAVGPVFGTRTKATGYDAVGLDLVAAAVRRAHGRPLVAIGGITLETAPSVIAAGAAGVAVISDLLADGNPSGRVAAYLRRL